MKKNEDSPLIQLLQQQGKTVEGLAAAMDVKERTVFYWLSGQRQPRFTLHQVKTLCDFFGLPFEQLPLDFSRDASVEKNNGETPTA